VAAEVRCPLEGLAVTGYYGCTLLRPKAIGIDRPDAPAVFGDLLEALGATVVTTPFDSECCGSYQIVDQRDVATDRSIRILRSAAAAGARVIATSCPLCAHNLTEASEGEIAAEALKGTAPEVVYFTELMAAAFDMNEAASPVLRALLAEHGSAVTEGA
jgi:heterodisulfide reductase subunit B